MAFVIATGNECYLLPLAENMGWNSAKKKEKHLNGTISLNYLILITLLLNKSKYKILLEIAEYRLGTQKQIESEKCNIEKDCEDDVALLSATATLTGSCSASAHIIGSRWSSIFPW